MNVTENNVKEENKFYSPLHTPINWQIPTRRKEIYMWSRFFATNDSTINSYLRLISRKSFEDEDWFKKAKEKNPNIDFDTVLSGISYEYFAMGDAFPFISYGDKNVIKGISVLNPDWIDVRINAIDPSNPTISLIPDDTLKQIAKGGLYNFSNISFDMIKIIVDNGVVCLNKRSVTHLKHNEIPYQPYGRGIIESLFPTLIAYDKTIVSAFNGSRISVISYEEKQREINNAFGLYLDNDSNIKITIVGESKINILKEKLKNWVIKNNLI